MNSQRRLFISQSILLLAVVVPLGFAERMLWFAGLTLLAVVLGWQTTVRNDRPLLGPQAGRLFVIGAFLLLVFEHVWLAQIPVLALAHFMILVCIGKLFQRRTFRDDAQLFILTLLLLVVAAIVSGSLLFPLALSVFLTVGIDAIIRFHLALESSRVEARNQDVAGRWGKEPPPGEFAVRGSTGTLVCPAGTSWSSGTSTVLIGISSLLVGIAIFMFSPRVLAGVLSPLEGRGGGRSVTGLSTTLNFNTIGTIAESDQPVMRVQIQMQPSSGGQEPVPAYFRKSVLHQYVCNKPLSGSSWEWRRMKPQRFQPLDDEDGDVFLLPHQAPVNAPMIVQRYWLEANGSSELSTCYPAAQMHLDIRLADLDGARKWIDDQVVQVERMPNNRTVRYTVHTPAAMTPALAEALAAERREAGIREPEVLLPATPLPQEAEILELINRLTADLGPVDTPENRLAFVRRLEEYLRSSEFTYTLKTQPPTPGREPIGEFLLNRRSGHCEYFASALAIMCQLRGIPARIVVGYCGGDYNPIGQFYVVRQKHAHSWVEAFIPGADWVAFDPTPAAGGARSANRVVLLGLRKYLDYAQFHWANLVVGYDADARRQLFNRFEAWLTRPVQNEDTVVGAVSAFVRELFGWRLKLTWRERLIYWVFSLLVVTLVVLLGYVLLVVLRWLMGWVRVRLLRSILVERPAAGEAEFYRRFCHRLASLGVSRPPGQTPAEFADELAQRYPLLADAPLLVQAYYEVFFGGRPLDERRQDRINVLLSQLREAEPNQLQPAPPSTA